MQTRSLADAKAPLARGAFVPLILHGPKDGVSSFGVQVYGTGASLAEKVSQTGAAWIRIPLDWASIEPVNTAPQQYTWSKEMDTLLAELSAQNVVAILTLSNNPVWAANYPGGPVAPLAAGELVQFMQAVVRRYGAPPYNVKHWEMYNEPDNGSPWFADDPGYGYFGQQPEAYVDMLRLVYTPIKAIDPDAQVVLGGLAYDGWSDSTTGGPFERDFLDKVLQNGGAAYFDLMNFHYYPAFRHVWDPHGHGIIGKANVLRAKLAEYGVAKPLICTEAGMWSDAAHSGSDELQSRYIAQLYARSAAAQLRPIIWYYLVDRSSLGSWRFGLLDPDLNPKPSFSAYRTATDQLASAQYMRTLRLDETGTDQLEAYEFSTPGSLPRLIVAWTNDGTSHPLTFEADQVVLVAKYGGSTVIYDISDGLPDGRIEISIGPSPVYLRPKP
jgi:hypothetical protein